MARKFLTSLDLNQNELQNARIQQLASAPGSPVEGQIYFNTTDHNFYVYNGTAWKKMEENVALDFGETVDISSSAVGDTAAAGSTGEVADAGHRHARESFGSATAQTSFGASSGNGSATTPARSDHTHGTPTHDASAHSTIKISDLAAPTASVSFNSQKITNLATPTSDSDAATKAYVDGVATGLDVKGSVRAATTANLDLSAPGSSIDGVTLTSGDRVLVKNQNTGSQNGIYVFNGAAAAMTRATDADSSAEVTAGMFTFIEEGTANSETGWVLATNNPITLGTTSLTFTQFNAQTGYVAGDGLSLSGSTFNVGAGTGITVAADSVSIDTSVVARKYSTSVGNGSATSFTVSHSLGTADVTVQVYDNSTGAQVEADVTHALSSPYAVTVAFATAPSSNAYRVVVIG